MNKLFRFVLVVTGLILFAANVMADQKIGYVELERIFKEAPQSDEGRMKLENEFSQRMAELAQLQNQINDQENPSTTKTLELVSLRIEFERKQRELDEDFNIRKNEELAALQDRINKAVTAISEADGYDLVIYSGIAYGSKRADLTDKVLKSLGKATP